MKYEHAYFTINGVEYKDYALYIFDIAEDIKKDCVSSTTILADEGFFTKLVDPDEMKKLCDSSFRPKLGDEIHIVPKCVISVPDIRNNYKTKRDFDTGVCNVFSEVKYSYQYLWVSDIIVNIDEKKALAYYCDIDTPQWKIQDFIYRARSAFSWVESGNQSMRGEKIFKSIRCSESYIHLLNGTAVTPCIHYSQLDFNRNALTPDILYMVYKAGAKNNILSKSHKLTEDQKTYGLELSVLSQTDFKKYPFTIHTLFYDILTSFILPRVSRKMSRLYPKQVQVFLDNSLSEVESTIINYGGIEDISKEDYDMAKTLVDMIIGINKGETKYIKLTSLQNGIRDRGINIWTLDKFYKCTVRIEGKKNERN